VIRKGVVFEPLPQAVRLRDRAVALADRTAESAGRPGERLVWGIPLVGALLGFAMYAIQRNGGTAGGLTSLFFLPILAAAYLFGLAGGAAAAVAAAGLCATLPLVTDPTRSQDPGSDLARSAIFLLVGASTGLLATLLSRQARSRHVLVDDAARGLWRALHAHDRAIAGHAERVSLYAQGIARQLGLPPERIDRVREAALLHNVGRLALPHGASNEPLVTERIIREVRELQAVLPIVRAHRERWDGAGFPDGLHSHQIPLEARIVAVANAYDNLTVPPPGRAAAPPDQAIALVHEQAGSRFDPAVVTALASLHNRWRAVLAPDFFAHQPPTR